VEARLFTFLSTTLNGPLQRAEPTSLGWLWGLAVQALALTEVTVVRGFTSSSRMLLLKSTDRISGSALMPSWIPKWMLLYLPRALSMGVF
jgi:hypothetical protein